MLFTVDEDTLPANSLTPVTAVIDPQRSGPGAGLTAATTGQRYLLTDNIGDSDNTDAADSWGNLVASANDIVQYNGSSWFVHFDASATETVEYVTNLNTNLQYKWDGNQWVRSYEGLYAGGKWSLVI